jgi:hypothetical protein
MDENYKYLSVFSDNKHGLQDYAFSVLSWSREQEHRGFIMVHAPLAKIIALRPTVCY